MCIRDSYNGTGTLAIQNGGAVDAFGNDANGFGILLGANSTNSSGAISVDGESSTLQVGAMTSFLAPLSGGGLEVGYNGTGSLSITNSGTVNLYGADIKDVYKRQPPVSASTASAFISATAWDPTAP